MKSFKPTIKIEPSKTTPNLYIVIRRNFLNSQEIAYAKVFPSQSYELEAIVHLSYEETQYIRKYKIKKANIAGKTKGCFIE